MTAHRWAAVFLILLANGCGGGGKPAPADSLRDTRSAPPAVAPQADSHIVSAVPPPEAYDWKRADSLALRLPPDSFPAIPGAVRADMARRGCTVPQNPEREERHNVISGSFIEPAQTDWVVLCSIARVSRILVYRGGRTEIVDSLGAAPDLDFLQSLGSPDKISFSRVIESVDKKYIDEHAQWYDGPKPPPIDHLGINDIFSGKASVVLYFHDGKWIALQGAD